MSYRNLYLHSTSIINENILSIELLLKSDVNNTTKTHRKCATSDESILGIRKEIQSRLLSLPMVGDSQDIVVSALTEGFCSDFVYLKLVCVKALGEEIGFSSRWASEGTAEVETEAEIWHSWVV